VLVMTIVTSTIAPMVMPKVPFPVLIHPEKVVCIAVSVGILGAAAAMVVQTKVRVKKTKTKANQRGRFFLINL